MKVIQVNALIKAFEHGQTKFNKIAIKHTNFAKTFLPFIALEESCLNQADFRHAVLPGASFKDSQLVEACFEHANLMGADLRLANLSRARLDHALITSANLEKAILRGASLVGVRLANTDLSYADLRNTNLIGANFQGANLKGANLLGARISPNALDNLTLESTTMPNGLSYSGHRNNYSIKPAEPLISYHTDGDVISKNDADTSGFLNLPQSQSPSHRTKRARKLRELKPLSASKANQVTKDKIIGFRLNENNADLILEILNEFPTQDKANFICVNHLF